MAMFQIVGDFDFDSVLNRASEVVSEERKGSVYVEGGRPEGRCCDTPGAQMIMRLRSRYADSDMKILVSHTGKIQFFYETLGDFCHCFSILKRLLGKNLSFDDEWLEKLELIDADTFEVCLAGLEQRYIRFNNDRWAHCANNGTGLDEQTLRNNVRWSLFNALFVLFDELRKVAEKPDVYDFTCSWVTTIRKAFCDVMLELSEDKNTAKQVIQDVVAHLQSLEEKWKDELLREANLERKIQLVDDLLNEHEKVPVEWIAGDLMFSPPYAKALLKLASEIVPNTRFHEETNSLCIIKSKTTPTKETNHRF